MNSLLLDHTAHLQKTIALLDAEAEYWRLNGKLWQRVTAYSVKLLGTALEVRLIRRDIHAMGRLGVIDENDLLADKLLIMQQLMRAHYNEFLPDNWQDFYWYQKWALWPVRRLLASIHQRLGLLRQYVLEHDADCGGVSAAGPFTESSQLLDHLNSL